MLHRTGVQPGEVYVAHAGVPHYLGPRISFIEVQEPSDHIVIPETAGDDDDGATMGLGWDVALDMIDYTPTDRAAALARARQRPSVVREQGENREVRLLNADVLDFFDATRLEVAGEMEVGDGRFYVGVVTEGEGTIEGDFGRSPIGKGETFACAASLGHRCAAGAAAARRPMHGPAVMTAPPTTGLAGLRYPITQISLAVEDLDATMALYHRAFGWAPWQVFDHVPPVHHAHRAARGARPLRAARRRGIRRAR